MMNETVLRELLGESLRREYAEFDNVPDHNFSLKHKLAMKHILARFDRNVRKLKKEEIVKEPPIYESNKRGSFKQRLIFATIIIVFMAFLAGWMWITISLYKIDNNTLEGYTVNEKAISQVKEQLKSEGIDADKRIPTHKITKEQQEWLNSRYDFDFLNACCFTHEEFGNFVLDLAYLNVFSLDEVKNMYGVMPFNANHKGFLCKLETDGGTAGFVNPFSGEGDLIEDEDLLAGLIMEYLKAKYTGLTEKEYERMTEEFAVQRRERLTLIEDFFAQVCNNKANNMGGVNRKVEDISEKLKEDFGGLI